MPLIRSTNVFYQGRLSRHITSPFEKLPRSGSCHYPIAAIKCNEQPSQATANPVGLFTALYSQHLLNHKVSCILQALNMPIIRWSYSTKGGYPVAFDSVRFCRLVIKILSGNEILTAIKSPRYWAVTLSKFCGK